MRYDYSIVRFVPDTFRGEFVNVGVIVGSADTGEWMVRRVGNSSRATRFGAGTPVGSVWAYLDDVERRIDEADDDIEDVSATGGGIVLCRAWLEEEHHRLRNVIQVTPPTAVVAPSVDEAMSLLFSELVVDPVKQTRNTRTRTVAALRHAYRTAAVREDFLHEKVNATVGRQQLPIDFAVGNGHLAQLAQAWSFQQQTPAATVTQVRAWTWTVHEVREHGGLVQVAHRDEPYEVGEDVAIEVVYDIPESDQGQRSLDEALDVFDRLNVTARPIAEVGAVAHDAALLLGTAKGPGSP